MTEERTFRRDIRRKLTLFALVPMTIMGLAGALLIYQAEEALMIDQHNRILQTVERLTEDYYRRVHFFFNVVHNKIVQGEMEDVKDGFDFSPFLYAVVEMDDRGNPQRIHSRESVPKTLTDDPHIQKLVRPWIRGKVHKKGSVFYCKAVDKMMLAHTFRHRDKIYLITADSDPFFSQFKYFLRRDQNRAISIINEEGIYIYDSHDANLSRSERSFFDEGAYAAAVERSEPYHIEEFPAHYRRGDSFWKGIFDNDHFLSYARVGDFNWIVTVRDFSDELDEYLQMILIGGIVLVLITILLTAIGAQMISNRTIIPVERLIQSIDAFATGKVKKIDTNVKVAYPLFRNLLGSFETMRGKIIARERKLSEQIKTNRQIEAQLIRQEKMAAMGEMIGNIAHQWRQPLSVISMLATGLQAEQEIGILSDKTLRESCDQINDNAQYLSRTIDDFRQFIKGEHEKQRFKARELTDTLQNLLKGQLKSHQITLTTAVDEDLKIDGYRNDLLQTLINLVSNAKDALVETDEEDRSILIEIGRSDAGEVVIRVQDNGGGIDAAIINRIFEPYFTTKHKSQGTGLGLYMVHRLIVEGMGGTIEVETIPCTKGGARTQGTMFTIVLPEETETPDPKGDT